MSRKSEGPPKLPWPPAPTLETSMKCWPSNIGRIAALATLLTPALTGNAQVVSTSTPSPPEAQPPVSELIVAVRINGQMISDSVRLLQPQTGRFFASADAFTEWRLVKPAKSILRVAGRD